MAYLLVIINVFIISGGQVFFKKSADYINSNADIRFPFSYLLNPWFYVAIFLYIVSTFVWTQALRKLPLSVAYPVVSLSYALTLLGAYLFIGEKINYLDMVGVALIMLGITLTVL